MHLGKLDEHLRKNVEIIAAFKERIKIFENENEATANENEELR